MTIFTREPSSHGTVVEFEISKIIHRQTTPYQELLVAHTPAYQRALFLDGLIQSSEFDDPIYHETLVHPAMFAHKNPRRVLVGGTGEGASVREILRHRGVEKVLTVDLDREVVEACIEHLPFFSAGAFADPRVESRFEDIQLTLDNPPAEPFDVVFLDLTDPVEEGPAAGLCTSEFYGRVANVMAEDGIVVVQSGELDTVGMVTPRGVRSALGNVFAHTHIVNFYVPCFHALWSFCLASQRPIAVDVATLDTKIAGLTGALRYYCAARHPSIWSLPPYLQQVLDRSDGDGPTGVQDGIFVYPRG